MKKKIMKLLPLFLLVVFIFIATIVEVQAQCPMCRMAAESNLQNGGTDGQGLNFGILYMLATPYFIIGAIAYFWWRNRKKEEEMEWEEETA